MPAQHEAIAVLIERLHDAGHERRGFAKRPAETDAHVTRPRPKPSGRPWEAAALEEHPIPQVPRNLCRMVEATTRRDKPAGGVKEDLRRQTVPHGDRLDRTTQVAVIGEL